MVYPIVEIFESISLAGRPCTLRWVVGLDGEMASVEVGFTRNTRVFSQKMSLEALFPVENPIMAQRLISTGSRCSRLQAWLGKMGDIGVLESATGTRWGLTYSDNCW
jgi:hypothetical protein